MKIVYKWWAALMLAAVVLQVGFAGYGAFFVAGKVDGDGKTVDEDTFMDGFGLHARRRRSELSGLRTFVHRTADRR